MMTTETKKPLKLFYCYARKDKDLRDELDIHLSSLKRQNLISSWYDGEISPGQDWEKEIDTQLQNAHLILLLVTPHFIASDYCYSIEMEHALQRHRDNTARVIPIILRRTLWENAPFSFLQVLPTDAKPVAQWADRDEAFWSIAVSIQKAIIELKTLLKTKQEWYSEGIVLINLKRYEEALVDLDRAIALDEKYSWAFASRGDVYRMMGRYEEALVDLDRAIALDEKYGRAFASRGETYRMMGRYEEALVDLDRAIALNEKYGRAFVRRGETYRMMGRYKEALVDLDRAIALGEKDSWTIGRRGDVYRMMK